MSGYVNVRDHADQMVDRHDWVPAFAAAILKARQDNRRGVLVPADAEDYTVRRPGPHTPSIDLRDLSGFTLLGEGDGSRIRMTGSGSGGSWNLILIGGGSVDVTVRGLCLDGDQDHVEDLDREHTHAIQIGGGDAGGSARRIRILDCVLTRVSGDGVAIVGTAGGFGGGNDVSAVDIIGCRFLDCGRSGVSNQRSVELVRIHRCHFKGTRGDQDIDMEPTGLEPGTGPRRYSIVGNTFLHGNDAAAVTLSGVAPDAPSTDNIFAHNHVYGGRVGMVDTARVQIVGNYIESGRGHGEPGSCSCWARARARRSATTMSSAWPVHCPARRSTSRVGCGGSR